MNPRLSAEQVLSRVKALPPLPQAVHELGEALRSDAVRIDRVIGVVGRDQALTTAALRLANSSFYGVSGRVLCLRDAVQILGLNTLSAAVMTAAVMARFDPACCPTFDFHACWRHAIATALCTQKLAVPRGLDGDEAYTVGLLHDIGRLALASHFPEAFAQTLAWAGTHDVPPLQAERELLGIDHAWVGGVLAEHWRLGAGVIEAIRTHHELPPTRGHGMLDALHLADNITHALDLSHEPDEMVPTLSIAAWERIGLSNAELQQLFEHIEERMQHIGRGH
jgi:putative nucleotidyltransferase with HDIG domain